MGKSKEKLTEGEAGSEALMKSLKKRIKILLQENDNLRCSECRSKKHKPKWMALLEAPIDATQNQLGVFCCDACHVYFVALGEDLCKLKSLKNPEDWTEEDVATMEKSGNKAVNAMYTSALEGNHTDKHIGALASAAFVESKYKDCLYFSEEAYNEQMQLRAMIQFAKNGVPTEAEPAKPSTEDLVRKALNRNKQKTVDKETEADADNSKRRVSGRKTVNRSLSADGVPSETTTNRSKTRELLRRSTTVDISGSTSENRRDNRRQSRRPTHSGNGGGSGGQLRRTRTTSGDGGRRASRATDCRGGVKPEAGFRRSSTLGVNAADAGFRRTSTTVGAPRPRGSRDSGRIKRTSDRSPAPGAQRQRDPHRKSDSSLTRSSDHELHRSSDHEKKSKVRSSKTKTHVRRVSRETSLLGRDDEDSDRDDDSITPKEPKPERKDSVSPKLIAGIRNLSATAPTLGKSLDDGNESDSVSDKEKPSTKAASLQHLYSERKNWSDNSLSDYNIDEGDEESSSSFSDSSAIDLSVTSSSMPLDASDSLDTGEDDLHNEKASEEALRRQRVLDILKMSETPTKGMLS